MSTFLIGEEYKVVQEELDSFGVSTFSLPKNNSLPEEISSHADILAFSYKDTLFLSDHVKGDRATLFEDRKVTFIKDVKAPYPKDCKLNVCLLKDKLFCNTNAISSEIYNTVIEDGVQIIHTNQGYTKCSICVINHNTVITEDDKLSSLLKIYQINVLTISKGYVHLSDKHYGFIGGCASMIANNRLYFNGDISKHPDYKQIQEFLYKAQVDLVFNSNRPLTDFGGLVAI